MKSHHRFEIGRRELLAGAAYLVLGTSRANATIIFDHLPWTPNAGSPPEAAKLGPWHFFSGDEGRAVEAIADRIIPPDPETPGGKDCGCAVFIDRQLAGPYGRNEAYYMMGPFKEGTKQQGPQSPLTIAQQSRKALAAFDAACRQKF